MPLRNVVARAQIHAQWWTTRNAATTSSFDGVTKDGGLRAVTASERCGVDDEVPANALVHADALLVQVDVSRAAVSMGSELLRRLQSVRCRQVGTRRWTMTTCEMLRYDATERKWIVCGASWNLGWRGRRRCCANCFAEILFRMKRAAEGGR